MKLWNYVNWPVLLFGLMIGFCIHSEWRLHKKFDKHIKDCEKIEQTTNKKELYFIVAYNLDGTINTHLLADYVRQNSSHHEVVVREWKTGETFIFSYPCSVNNVTFAQDYIKFTNEK